jgi:type I restriction enzyme S subunit
VSVALAEIAQSIDYGVTASAKAAPVGPQFLRITDIQDGGVDWGTVPFCETSPSEEAAAKLVPGDIVFARTGATTGKSFLLRECPERAVFASYLIRVRPDIGRVEPRYLAWFFQTPEYWRQITSSASGTAQPGVNASKLKSLAVPMLPPLPEQRRIADILDKADAIRRKRKEAIALTEELLRSAFLEMFGDPVTNPKGWPVKPLGDLVDIRGGGTPSRARSEFFAGHVPWATAKDFRSEFMSDTEEHVSEDAIASSATKLVPQGTILIVVKSKILMRRLPVAISTVPLCFNQDVKGLVARDLSEGPYIAAHIRMAQRKLLELARGVNTEGLTLDHLRGHPVMRPPVDEVHRFVRLEATIRRSADVNARGAQAAEDLFNALVARAFSGELS